MQHVEVSFVIPCLNEEKTLEKTILLCKAAIDLLKCNCEIVVADNGSTDNSKQIARQYNARVVDVEQKGYGNALINGINASNGKYIVMGDADATYNFVESVEFIKALQNEQLDLVIGSRLKGKIENGAMPFLHRYLGTPVLTFLIRNFFNINISDCNCGMRAFTKEAFNRLNMISGGMEFASEMLIKAGILKLKVKEINCSLAKDTRDRKPHLRTWRDGWRHLRFILAFASKFIFFYPGIISIIMGTMITISVMFKPLHIASVIFDYNFMYIGLLFFIIGYQLIWLNKFEKEFIKFSGLYPKIKSKSFSFDRYAILSLILLILGAILSFIAVIDWKHHLFYASGATIRIMITAIWCIITSFVTFTNALIISMMSININNLQNNQSGDKKC